MNRCGYLFCLAVSAIMFGCRSTKSSDEVTVSPSETPISNNSAMQTERNDDMYMTESTPKEYVLAELSPTQSTKSPISGKKRTVDIAVVAPILGKRLNPTQKSPVNSSAVKSVPADAIRVKQEPLPAKPDQKIDNPSGFLSTFVTELTNDDAGKIPSETSHKGTVKPTTTVTRTSTLPKHVVARVQPAEQETIRGYKILGVLGKGAAGKVYLVDRDGTSFVLKQMKIKASSRNEVVAYNLVKGKLGFSQIIESWEDIESIYMVSTRVGQSIEDMRTQRGGMLVRLPVETVGSIALQMIDRLETIHSLGIVHGDLYPNNMAVGLGEESNTLFVFDFGESNDYRNPDPRKTRLFDIQSLSHTVHRLLVPGTLYGDYQHWQDARITLAELCEGLPDGVAQLFDYSHKQLGRHEAPDYELLRTFMSQLNPNYEGEIFWN